MDQERLLPDPVFQAQFQAGGIGCVRPTLQPKGKRKEGDEQAMHILRTDAPNLDPVQMQCSKIAAFVPQRQWKACSIGCHSYAPTGLFFVLQCRTPFVWSYGGLNFILHLIDVR
jgi:hypothetical protein